MAQRTTVVLIDDLDGGEADETVGFGLDGATYEIDLNGMHATALRDELGAYIARARRTGRAAAPRGARHAIPSTGARNGRDTQRSGAGPEDRDTQRSGAGPEDRDTQRSRAGDAVAPTATSAPPEPAVPATRTAAADAASKVGPDGLTGDERERIRSWAQDEGIEVKARGRLTRDLIANYRVVQSRR